jgi:LPXTG-site transpeptidase (sortase) family protein
MKWTNVESSPKSVQALSWGIATEPELYWELASNPYRPHALQIISERFPGVGSTDVIRAVIFAEPEGKYDRNFTLLLVDQQEEELRKQKDTTAGIDRRLIQYLEEYAKALRQLPKEILYDSLSKFVFGTNDIKEIEERFSQGQRRSFKLTIVNFIGDSLVPVSGSQRDPLWGDPILNLTLATLSLLLIFFASQQPAPARVKYSEANTQVLAANVQNTVQGFPVRLRIPSINVDAVIEYVGVAPSGVMGVPVNTSDVAWFDLGPKPGEMGSAVIAGHFDGIYGENAVFGDLDKLKEGDILYIEDSNGVSTTFVVQGSRAYNPGYADDVFSRNDGTYLNLITCDGVWDGSKKSFSKRLVVFTTIMR